MSSLPYRQLRNRRGAVKPLRTRSLPYRQLRNRRGAVKPLRTRSLPYRQLRKLYSANEVDVDGSLPYRLLRNSYLTNCCSSAGSLSNRQIKCEKSSYFRTRFSLNMTVRGGLTRFARPAGSPLTVFVVCPTGCASCRTPVGASHPPWSAICEKKARTFVRALL